MISTAEAYARLLATAHPLPPETLPLAQAAGRVLAESLAADRDFPPFDRVAMDGIAVAHAAWAGGQTVFPIAHAQFAGAAAQPLPGPGVAAEVMTGAVLPPGADTVVRYEDITITNPQATINIVPPARVGANVHTQAADRRRGDLLLPAGTRLTPAALAVAATVGAAEVRVTRLARVAVVSTGDELVDVATTPLPHQIRRSNAYAVQALLAPTGADVHLFHLPDDLPTLRQGLTNILAAGFDAVVLSGAVSKGRADHVPTLLRELGVVEIFHEVNQRPGKPMWFEARDGGGPVVFGLPGNPVSTLLTAARYVRPWLLASQQPAAGAPGPTPAVLTAAVQFRPALAHLLPVAIAVDAHGVRRATPVAVGGSGDLAGLLGADAFLDLPAELTDFAAGTAWPAWPL